MTRHHTQTTRMMMIMMTSDWFHRHHRVGDVDMVLCTCEGQSDGQEEFSGRVATLMMGTPTLAAAADDDDDW